MKYLCKLTILTFLIFSFISCNESSPPIKESTKLNPVEQLDSLRSILKNLLKINDSLKTELQRQEIKFKSLEEVSTGEFVEIESKKENEAYGFNYRIEIYQSEIYKSLYLTKVEFYGEGSQRISSTYMIDLDKELNISSEETNGLQFVKWHSPFSFEILVYNKTHIVQIINSQKVEMKNRTL